MPIFADKHRGKAQRGSTPAPPTGSRPAQSPEIRQILRRKSVQPKLKVGAPNDKYEHEADRVMTMPAPAPDVLQQPFETQDEELQAIPMPESAKAPLLRQPSGQEEELQAKPQPGATPAGTGVEAPRSAGTEPLAGLGRGRPLSSPLRAFFEPRFGREFGTVQVHDDDDAHDRARAFNAQAFAYGRNLVFGEGRYQSWSHQGRRLIAHELAHVVQQSGRGPNSAAVKGATTTPSQVQIFRSPNQDASALAGLPGRSPDFDALWRTFRVHRHGSLTPALRAEAQRLLRAMIATASQSDRQTKGLDLAIWFRDHGMATEAEEALSAVEGAWLVGAVLHRSDVPPAAGFSTILGGPGVLIDRAERAARANNHTEAFRFFGLAFLFLQMQLVQATERLRNPDGAHSASTTRALFVYPTFSQIYDRLRHIIGFYLDLERTATATGQTQQAAQYRALSDQLQRHLRQRFIWSGEAMIAEVTRVQTRMGPGLRLYGANMADTDMTAFQGLPTPEEVGARSYQWQSLEAIAESLGAQVQFLGELRRRPEIQRAFRGQTIDMNNVSHRHRIWRTMLAVYQQQGGGTDALRQLMALIGRYLRSFTIHTQYNIRDWGQNYLTSDLPVDLAGRAERDCGVYALTVAYEVFRAARSASPRINLQFEITVVPSHVVLVIYDVANSGFYVVNNDQVSPRRAGAPKPKQLWRLRRAASPAVTTSSRPASGWTLDPCDSPSVSFVSKLGSATARRPAGRWRPIPEPAQAIRGQTPSAARKGIGCSMNVKSNSTLIAVNLVPR